MCFGGGDSSKGNNNETFHSAIDVYNRFYGYSKITNDKYIDPLEYEYNRTMVKCGDCLFRVGLEKCLIFKELGHDDSDIKRKMRDVMQNHYCDYFIIEHFSETDNDDEVARTACSTLRNKLY